MSAQIRPMNRVVVTHTWLMLTVIGSRERTPGQLFAVLARAGFAMCRVFVTAGSMRIVGVRPA